MTENRSNTQVHDHEIDRLVDGELSDLQYRELLSRMDEVSGSWRRCSLAFLESQALHRELSGNLLISNVAAVEKTNPIEASTSPRARGIGSRVLALAASVIVAFSLGWFGNSFSVDQTENVPPTNIVANPSVTAPAEPERAPAQFVYVNQWDGPSGTRVPVPIDMHTAFNPEKPWDDSWGIPNSQINQLRQEGYEVEARNEYIPVSLETGENVIIPIQEVIWHPTETRPFH